MQQPAYQLRRIILPRTPVNKGKKEGPRLLLGPGPSFSFALCSVLRAALLYQWPYSARRIITDSQLIVGCYLLLL
jgi:hypothetical protein